MTQTQAKKMPTLLITEAGTQANLHCTSRQTGALVQIQGDTLYVDSNVIANLFDRPHRNLMRDLDKLTKAGVINALSLERITYPDSRGRSQFGWRLSERDALVLMPYLGGTKSAQGQAKLVDEFLRMRTELRRVSKHQATVAWQQARLAGKTERRGLTDAVQALARRAYERGDSTTPLFRWEMSATKSVTASVFILEHGEKVKDIRERLTARQLNRLAMAEDIFAEVIFDHLGGDLRHSDINLLAKQAVDRLVTGLGGKAVPGIDRRAAANDRQLERAA